MYLATVDCATLNPSSSSFAVDAWRTPKLVLRAHLPDQRAQFHLDSRAPSPLVRCPTPIATKAGPMPPHQRFRLDNRNDRQDRWKPSIHLGVGKVGSTAHLAPQDDQLMSEHRILRLKRALRLERRGQHGQNKPNQRDHRASLADSVTRKIRIRFSVHTPPEGNALSLPGPPQAPDPFDLSIAGAAEDRSADLRP